MEKEEFYQQAMLMAMNGLLSSIGNGLAPDADHPHALIAEMAHDYAKALTDRTFIQTAKFKERYL